MGYNMRLDNWSNNQLECWDSCIEGNIASFTHVNWLNRATFRAGYEFD
jgi:hypothetical protein